MDELQLQEDVLTAALYSVLGDGVHDIKCAVYYGSYMMRVRVNDHAIGGKCRIILYQNKRSQAKGNEHIVACLVNALTQKIPAGQAVRVKVHGKTWDIMFDGELKVFEVSLWARIRGWFGL